MGSDDIANCHPAPPPGRLCGALIVILVSVCSASADEFGHLSLYGVRTADHASLGPRGAGAVLYRVSAVPVPALPRAAFHSALPIVFRWRTLDLAVQRFPLLCNLNLEATRTI